VRQKEGKYTQEGGGGEKFNDRIKSQEELYKMLEYCFDGKEEITN
jgi:hypothetical protein